MAKELPYFKFYCSEWNDGDITLEEFRTQGVFINICSLYWSRGCNLTLEKLKRRFKDNVRDIEVLLSIQTCNQTSGISFSNNPLV